MTRFVGCDDRSQKTKIQPNRDTNLTAELSQATLPGACGNLDT